VGWAALGIVGVLVVAWYTVSVLALVVTPLLLALFPATLLYPLVKWLRGRGMHRTLAAILSLRVGIVLLAVVGGFAVSMVVNGLPELLESAEGGVLLGVLGALLAVPVATAVRVLLEPEKAPTSWRRAPPIPALRSRSGPDPGQEHHDERHHGSQAPGRPSDFQVKHLSVPP